MKSIEKVDRKQRRWTENREGGQKRWTENKSKTRMIIWNPWHGRHKISEGRQRDNGVDKQTVIKNIFFEKILRNLS